MVEDAYESETPKMMYDLFESLPGGEYYVPLAAANAEEWLSGQTVTLWIRPGFGRYWISRDDMHGEIDFDTLARAKKEGTRLWEESYRLLETKVMDSLKLSAADWQLTLEDGAIILASVADPGKTLVRSSTSKEWALYSGDDVVGTYTSPKEVSIEPTATALSM